MANQPSNYGLPSFGVDTQSLVQPVQITPGRLSVSPPASNVQAAMARRERRAERKAIADDQRRMLLASVLSGPMATGITSLLGKVFPKLTEESMAAGYPSLEGLDGIDRAQVERGREIADAVYGEPTTGRRGLSRTGRVVRDIIAAAPGLAAKTPEGLSLFQKGRESIADVEAAVATARAQQTAAQDKARTDLIRDIAKEDVTRAMFHGAILRDGESTPTAVSRVGATMKDGRVMFSSKGQPFDRDVDGNSVKAGEWYFNPALAARLVKAELSTYPDVRMKNLNSSDRNNPEYLSFFPRDVVTPDGRVIREYVAFQGGKEVTQAELNAQGDNWVKAADQEVAGLKPDSYGFGETNNADSLTASMFPVAHRLLALTERAKLTGASPQSLVGTLANFANDLRVNFSSVVTAPAYKDSKGFTNHLRKSFSTKNGDFQGQNSLELFRSLNTYLDTIASSGKSAHPQALRVFKEDLNRFFQNAQASDYSLAGNFGTDEAQNEFFDGVSKNLQAMSADRALMMAAQLQLGYLAAAAAGQTGRTLSDKDLAFFLRIVGFGESADPVLQAEAVTQFISDQLYRAENEASERNFDYLRDGLDDAQDVEYFLRRTLNIPAEDIETSKSQEVLPTTRKAAQAKIRHILNRRDIQAGNHFTFDEKSNTWRFIGKRERLRNFNHARYFFEPFIFVHPNTDQEIEIPGWLEKLGVNRFGMGNRVDVRRNAPQGAPTPQGATDADSDAAAAAAMKALGL